MDYLVLDLEMCKVPKNYRRKDYQYATETIQIGAVLLNESYEQIDTFREYVHPEYGVLDYFITNLTGIDGRQVKNASRLKEVLEHLLTWIGEREYCVFAWSDTDYLQLRHETESKRLWEGSVQQFLQAEHWVDYQDVFGKRYDLGRAVGLEEALMLCDIEADGRMHDGLDDALNTAKIIAKLEQNPDYELLYRERENEVETEPLKTSLGDLFAGLNLDLKE